MANAHIHAQSSARTFGGTMEDYLDMHQLMDSSFLAIPDNRHRFLTHTNHFVENELFKIYGPVITISTGKLVSVKEIGKQHILEDYKSFIPTVEDFLFDYPKNKLTSVEKIIINSTEITSLQHALEDVKKYGGKVENYLPIHRQLDSSLLALTTQAHKIVKHNQWYVSHIIPKIFGSFIINEDGEYIDPIEIASQHIKRELNTPYVSTVQQWIEDMPLMLWMQNGVSLPPSMLARENNKVVETVRISAIKAKFIE